MWIAGLVLLLAPDPPLDEILAVLDARDGALKCFAAQYYDTVDGERIGPRFFAWSRERSLYRGPKFSTPIGVQGWLTSDRVQCESIYFQDTRQVLWLRRELEPVTMVWQGTRKKNREPWTAEESGLFWNGRLLSQLFRERPVRVLGREPANGHPCVKVMVTNKDGEFPDVLWLAEDCAYFPCRALEHRQSGPASVVKSAGIRVGEQIYVPTNETYWDDLRRAGPLWYPTRVRISSMDDDDVRVIEAVPGGVRFNDDVTSDDFELPWLYFLRDSVDPGYAAVTPFLRITPEGGGVFVVILVGGSVIVWRRRRRAART